MSGVWLGEDEAQAIRETLQQMVPSKYWLWGDDSEGRFLDALAMLDAAEARSAEPEPFGEIIADGLTDSQIRYLWRRHRRRKLPNGPYICRGCENVWPCEMRLALQTIDLQRINLAATASTEQEGT